MNSATKPIKYSKPPKSKGPRPDTAEFQPEPQTIAALWVGGLRNLSSFRLKRIITPIRVPFRLLIGLLMAYLLSPPTLQVQNGKNPSPFLAIIAPKHPKNQQSRILNTRNRTVTLRVHVAIGVYFDPKVPI